MAAVTLVLIMAGLSTSSAVPLVDGLSKAMEEMEVKFVLNNIQ